MATRLIQDYIQQLLMEQGGGGPSLPHAIIPGGTGVGYGTPGDLTIPPVDWHTVRQRIKDNELVQRMATGLIDILNHYYPDPPDPPEEPLEYPGNMFMHAEPFETGYTELERGAGWRVREPAP